MKYNFSSDHLYSRIDIKTLVNAPNPQRRGGIWYTGYTFFNDCLFIFATLETPGRTGHNYNNILKDDELFWFGKNTHSINSKSIQKMLSGTYETYIFTRKRNDNPYYNFQGLGYLKNFEKGSPVHIVWGITNSLDTIDAEFEINHRKKFIEGIRTESLITKYERNQAARTACLKYYGYSCQVCKMNFEDYYGSIGKEFIHVHHRVEISSMTQKYEIDPLTDLIPICPNCHAMLHTRKPALTPDELIEIIKQQK